MMAGNTLLKKLILLGVALVVGIGAGWFIRARVLTPVGDSDKGGSFGASVVTEEQYNKAKYGMTYEEIKALFGSEGEFQKEMGEASSEGYAVWRGWDAENKTYVTMSFRHDGTNLVLVYKVRRAN